MNQEYDSLNRNKYEGNGWSKYQVLVLQQLEDHNAVLKNLNQEISNIKQIIAVSEAENKMWKAQVSEDVKRIQNDIDYIVYDEKGVNNRLTIVEHELEIENHYNVKWRATWALYGSLAVFFVNVLLQIFTIFYKK
jgi:hypothetical protein